MLWEAKCLGWKEVTLSPPPPGKFFPENLAGRVPWLFRGQLWSPGQLSTINKPPEKSPGVKDSHGGATIWAFVSAGRGRPTVRLEGSSLGGWGGTGFEGLSTTHRGGKPHRGEVVPTAGDVEAEVPDVGPGPAPRMASGPNKRINASMGKLEVAWNSILREIPRSTPWGGGKDWRRIKKATLEKKVRNETYRTLQDSQRHSHLKHGGTDCRGETKPRRILANSGQSPL